MVALSVRICITTSGSTSVAIAICVGTFAYVVIGIVGVLIVKSSIAISFVLLCCYCCRRCGGCHYE